MIDKKTGLMLGAAAAAVVVLGAAAVAAIDWRGSPRPVAALPAQAADAGDSGADTPAHRRTTSRSNANFALLKFDTDHDGRITRAEVDAGIMAEFQTIDANHDGKLDEAEYQTYDAARRAARKAWATREGADPNETPPANTFDPMKRLDWNRDGFITPDEFGGRLRSIAMRLDRDGDGVVLVEDIRATDRSRSNYQTAATGQ